MLRTLTPGRLLAAIALAGAALVIAPSPASAHAGVQSSSPANGSQLTSPPKSVTVTFEEEVELAGRGTKLVDGNGRTVPSKATVSGTKVTITPASPLAKGRYAASWKVLSEDGDTVTGAISFTVDLPNRPGKPVSITAKPAVTTTLSAALPGSRTLVIATKAVHGHVQWTSAKVPGAITWEFEGNGRSGSAKGVLPTPGEWTFEATLEMPDDAIVVVVGTVNLKG